MRRTVASYEAVSRTDVALWDHEQTSQFAADAQRDIGALADAKADLLEALKAIRDGHGMHPGNMQAIASAAIAKAEGQP